uniref:Uncharacterized protein n=1 Tax=Anguilla anguilla TaxID=7936 RepID=A0A0E9U8F2_ANGAN
MLLVVRYSLCHCIEPSLLIPSVARRTRESRYPRTQTHTLRVQSEEGEGDYLNVYRPVVPDSTEHK